MGTGSGSGQGTGKGVKGGWRVSAFLLLLTGWQAVLLPWSPLILKDAGFSATSVGLLSGGTTMAASVGVVMCLRGMRRSRSGAVRRLFLWLMLATATLLQGCGVGLELRHLTQGGVTSFCVSGWLLTPATPVFLLNNMSTPITPQPPKIVSQQPHTLSTIATTTLSPPPSPLPPDGSHETGTTVNPHLKHTSSHRPAPPNTTTTTTSTTTTPVPTTIVIPTFIPLIPVTPTKTTTTTTVPATTTRTSTPPVTTTSIPPTVPAVKTSTKKSNNKIPLKNTVNTVESLSSGDDGDTKESYRPPGGQGKHQAEHQPLIPARDGGLRKHHYHNIQRPHASLENHGRGKTFGKIDYPMNPKNTQLSDDNDQPTSQDSSEDNDDNHLQYVDEYDNNNEESEEKGDEDDHENDLSKLFNYYPKLASHFRSSFGKLPQSEGNALPGAPKTVNFLDIPPNPLQDNVPIEGNAALWKSYFKGINNKAENSFQSPQHTDHFTTTKRKQSKLSDQDSLPPISSLTHHSYKSMPSMTDIRRPHHPSFQIQEPSDGEGQYRDYLLHQIGSRHSLHKRSLKTESKGHVHPVKVTTNETKPQHDEKLENKQNLIEVKSETIKVGVAVLLVLGGLAGAGVEAGVAQLWHCFIHGYDEGGVSQDVLQRTITHTFHLSTYGNHKTWTGITSGGWVMGAGVVSILACMAGTGGGGYGGLLGVHLALGTGALLLLLLLPVPYGSIDPPRTRRPLSLYLDDEVLREGVRRLIFHLWVLINGCLAALSLTFSLWLLREMTPEGWLVGSQAVAVGMTLVCESLALHTQRRLVTRWGLHGLMGVCGVSLMLHYGFMWASNSVGMVVVAHAGLGVAMAFLWVAVKHNALLLATVSDQEREAWASWWCWRIGMGVGAAVWGVGVSAAGDRVRPLLLLATLATATLAASLCVTAVFSRRNSRTKRRVYHTLDLDIANDEVDEENDAAEDDWLVKRAKKEGLTL